MARRSEGRLARQLLALRRGVSADRAGDSVCGADSARGAAHRAAGSGSLRTLPRIQRGGTAKRVYARCSACPAGLLRHLGPATHLPRSAAASAGALLRAGAAALIGTLRAEWAAWVGAAAAARSRRQRGRRRRVLRLLAALLQRHFALRRRGAGPGAPTQPRARRAAALCGWQRRRLQQRPEKMDAMHRRQASAPAQAPGCCQGAMRHHAHVHRNVASSSSMLRRAGRGLTGYLSHMHPRAACGLLLLATTRDGAPAPRAAPAIPTRRLRGNSRPPIRPSAPLLAPWRALSWRKLRLHGGSPLQRVQRAACCRCKPARRRNARSSRLRSDGRRPRPPPREGR